VLYPTNVKLWEWSNRSLFYGLQGDRGTGTGTGTGTGLQVQAYRYRPTGTGLQVQAYREKGLRAEEV